jgi:hypothetical protein
VLGVEKLETLRMRSMVGTNSRTARSCSISCTGSAQVGHAVHPQRFLAIGGDQRQPLGCRDGKARTGTTAS